MSEIRVLIVDDEAPFTETVVKRLTRRGMIARAANSGPEALAALDESASDVVICDVKMPGMDGLAALGEIKKRHPKVEVVLLTGHASVASGAEGMKLGAFDYMLKPADFDELVEKIRQAAQHGQGGQ